MKHFLISVSVSKVDYRGKVKIIFIVTKAPSWLSYLTWSLAGEAFEKFCKWLFCSFPKMPEASRRSNFAFLAATLKASVHGSSVQNSACWKAAYYSYNHGWKWYCGTFWCFTKFAFHDKSNKAWLLVINKVYTSCLTNCQTT